MTERASPPDFGGLLAAGQTLLSGGWKRDRLSVLIFHRLLREPDPLLPGELTVDQFRHHLDLLNRHFRVLPLPEALRCLRENRLPPKTVSITFDDGYRDNVTLALPLLQKRRLHATFFIASGFLNQGRMWNDSLTEIVRRWPEERIDCRPVDLDPMPVGTLEQRRETLARLLAALKQVDPAARTVFLEDLQDRLPDPLPTDLMMTDEQVRLLHRAGMEIGCHTRSHPILRRVSLDTARQEIEGGRDDLQQLIDAPVRFFAFPNGVPHQDYERPHVELLKTLGFEAAFSTSWGVVTRDSDPYQLPRFTPWDKSRLLFWLRLILSRRVVTYPVV